MKTAYLRFKECNTNEAKEENFRNVGNNSGNIVFDYSLMNTIKCTPIEVSDLEKRAWEFDNLVVRDFIWLREDTDMSYFRRVMDLFKDKAIIPISAGLQSEIYNPHFKLHKNTIRILKELEEKAQIAVRGEYTAEIFNKHGIKNIRIVGCPSMYLGANYDRKIVEDRNNFLEKGILANYKTLSKELNTDVDVNILHYFIQKSNYFMEQTRCYLPDELRKNQYKEFMPVYVKKRTMFFVFEDWYKFCLDKGFSIGARFHGNVVPILAGVPALFIIFDSRTKELTDYFNFPTIDVSEFETSKPIEYYYELADYSKFNKTYPEKLDNFIDFCLNNNLELNSGMEKFFFRKLELLRRL
ncbi:polysaccharide pyruvyl transferase family protein [Blautia sp.]|uniref:polysaccharide pyruvyl transferase family protein n=1 Tax=Blautia sp. TaxID=1955243 RepID=UPI0025B8A915|nr:polysaccharide pyruvyl transferase family protein [Blautia sp.]